MEDKVRRDTHVEEKYGAASVYVFFIPYVHSHILKNAHIFIVYIQG